LLQYNKFYSLHASDASGKALSYIVTNSSQRGAMARPSSLSAPASELVLGLLRKSGGPLTAYELLGKLKTSGVKSAPIVYRALEVLVKDGTAHKIKELGSYVACDGTHSHQHALSVLTVCGDCHEVKELHNHSVIHQLESLRNAGVRLQENAVIELPIICNSCAA
jgi:Fur family transcriptional regulator, zinc uptake regulator